ncbi:glutathione peroxidase [Sandaracinobacteroides saxicola]|uniref:Glutathione peroxidase n=1 Tax=Sandaracinobacteroides saxicola TaxID=2759707 RepID=A0A7G5IFX7_9SPHN|nr:glutathione peroxidase [Sandaracinobacteroides saxicola]QMW22269.1 glutathione peroxidase [Sandaracinobacteroides saxicola]
MRKTALTFGAATAITIGVATALGAFSGTATAQATAPRSAFDFTMTRIDGKPLPLAQYRGKVMLVVNTASFCGFTPQYEGLQKIQTKYAAKGFTVLGVPSGDFMGQEYDDNGKIKEFCETKFGINFPMAEKAVVTGAKAAPFYQWARTQISENNVPKWNFHKFLVGKDGRIIAGFGSRTTPESPEMTKAIEAALKA